MSSKRAIFADMLAVSWAVRQLGGAELEQEACVSVAILLGDRRQELPSICARNIALGLHAQGLDRQVCTSLQLLRAWAPVWWRLSSSAEASRPKHAYSHRPELLPSADTGQRAGHWCSVWASRCTTWLLCRTLHAMPCS